VECRDVQNLLHPFVDGELDLVRQLQIEHHLAECAECAERTRGLRQLREALASPSLYHHAPDSLRRQLQSTSAAPTRLRRWKSAVLFATAAGIVLVVAGFLAGGFLLHSSADDRLTEEVVAGHIRSLQVAHATDVPSSQQHIVKPWFQGKTDFAPQVPDLSIAGFELTGGRLDYLDNHSVAALVYHRRDHLINVFTWPAADAEEQPVRSRSRQGFHIRSWRQAGMAYWVISDLNDQELDEFVKLFQMHIV